MNNNPLVSVVVITYNSSKYVLETLESVKNQIYQNIELIISDDCSTDDTVDVCKDWIEKNRERFVRTKLIESEINTGIPANCNRGYKEAKGEWVKSIAGDDALYSNAIEYYVNFIALYPKAQIIYSRMDCYEEILQSSPLRIRTKSFKSLCTLENIRAKKQYNILCINNLIAAPTVFVQSALWQEMDGFDERIYRCEDWPMWLKITNAGIPFYFMDKVTVKYRITSGSTMGQEIKDYLFRRFFEMENLIYEFYIKDNASICFKLMNRYDFYLRYFLDKLSLNKQTKVSRFTFFLLNMPYALLNKLYFLLDRYFL